MLPWTEYVYYKYRLNTEARIESRGDIFCGMKFYVYYWVRKGQNQVIIELYNYGAPFDLCNSIIQIMELDINYGFHNYP